MDLTAEQMAIGRENFAAAIGSPLIRRDFLLEAVRKGLSSGKGLGPYYFGYEPEIGNPIRVGVIGTGDEGCVLIGAINPQYIQVAAIADIRPYSIHRAFHGDCYSSAAHQARPGLLAKYGWQSEDEARRHVNVYAAYQELLQQEKDLDGVIIALPLHLHAPAAIAAMKAGLHVLTEKLMAHSVHECKEMARVAASVKKHLATGHQRHYSILYDNAVELVRRGLIGQIHYIRAQWHRGNLPGNDSWQQPMPKSAKPDDPLAGTLERELASWENRLAELKQAGRPNVRAIEELEARIAQKKAQIRDEQIANQAAQFGYQDAVIEGVYARPAIEELIRWRLWDRTGGGLMAELGSHQLDAASIFIAAMHGGHKQHPLVVAAAAHRPLFPADRDVEDHVYSMFEFPSIGYDPHDPYGRMKKIPVSYASINGNGWGGYGETVFGTKGTLILDRETEASLFFTHEVNQKTRVVQTSEGPALQLVAQGDTSPAAVAEDQRSATIGAHALLEVTRGYTEQLEHWAWCIRRNPDASDPDVQPRCRPVVALTDAVIALTANQAARAGQQVAFDPRWFDPDSDETPENVQPDVNRYA